MGAAAVPSTVPGRETLVAVPYGALRVAIGATVLLAPAFAGRRLLGVGDAPRTVACLRLLGVRDLALGVGLLRALPGPGAARLARWGAVADASDVVAAALLWPRVGPLRGVLGVGAATGGALTGLWLSRRIGAGGR